jgi:hypothetical protein
MTILAQVDWGACLLEPRRDQALESFARSEFGVVPQALAYFAAATRSGWSTSRSSSPTWWGSS